LARRYATEDVFVVCASAGFAPAVKIKNAQKKAASKVSLIIFILSFHAPEKASSTRRKAVR
jgi:hypothetical protein